MILQSSRILRIFVNKKMYKIFALIILSLAFLAAKAQEINQVTTDPLIERDIFLGQMNETGMSQPLFVENWKERVDLYDPDKVWTKKIRRYLKKNEEVSLIVFFASWCGDSQEHMPDFIKLVHQTKMKKVSFYALNRNKTMPGMDMEKYVIEYVPTFIVYRGGQEIGRIVESPDLSLEQDLWKILENNP